MKEKSARRVRASGRDEAGFLLEDATARKLKSVLRLAPGDSITVIDETGFVHAATIVSLDAGRARAMPILGAADEGRALPAPWPLTVGLAAIKGDRMDWAMEKLSEIGVARILPVICDRSATREIGAAKQERWTRIAETAALQCGRARPAEVLAPALTVADALRSFTSPWHGAPGGRTPRDLSAAARSGPDDEETNPTTLAIAAPDLLLVGPEGGWSDEESAILAARSLPIDLGLFVLRTETAALSLALLGVQFISERHKGL